MGFPRDLGIPAYTPPPPPPPPPEKYRVEHGDTLEGIANRFGTSVEALQQANPTVSAARIMPGDMLQIPPPNAPAAGGVPTPAPTPQQLVNRAVNNYNEAVADKRTADLPGLQDKLNQAVGDEVHVRIEAEFDRAAASNANE